MSDSHIAASTNLTVPARDGRRARPSTPLLTCLSTDDQACGLRAVTLQIEADRKLSLADMASVAGALGPILGRIAAAIAAGHYEAVVENPQFGEVIRYHGPDGEVFPHWGMAFDGGFVSSVGIQRSRRWRPRKQGALP